MNMTGRCDAAAQQLPQKGRKQMEYRFRRAQSADVDQMIEIITDRIEWMDRQGLHQWNKTHYMQRYPREYFLAGIEKGLLYVALDEQNRVAGLMALLTEDPRWAEDKPKNCYYVHHLAAKPDAKGAGKALLEFCRQLSVQEGRECIRLDCQLGNDRLNAFYEDLGYVYAGPMVEDDYEGIKREKAL